MRVYLSRLRALASPETGDDHQADQDQQRASHLRPAQALLEEDDREQPGDHRHEVDEAIGGRHAGPTRGPAPERVGEVDGDHDRPGEQRPARRVHASPVLVDQIRRADGKNRNRPYGERPGRQLRGGVADGQRLQDDGVGGVEGGGQQGYKVAESGRAPAGQDLVGHEDAHADER
ncbi:MAG: hypothetical protein M3O95_08690 [Candidatus Dormibacteraeota bacterium]|nr:hypothetical protein [Candidatus Dormibacteraeota bacterium]